MIADLSSVERDGYSEFAVNPKISTFEVASSIGSVERIPGLELIQELRPRAVSEKSSYSGIYGLNAFPLHSDMAHWYVPPRYLLLRCVNPANVQTKILHSRNLIDDKNADLARRAIFRPRRRIDGRLTMLKLYERGLFRWDSEFIRPVSRSAGVLAASLSARIASCKAHGVTMSRSGDCILIDNWKCLHGRSEVSELSEHRLIERAYLSSLKDRSYEN